jgi:hypothetical protein
LPWPMRACRTLRAVVPSLIPSEVSDFCNFFPKFGGDFCLSVCAAMLKTPNAVRAWVDTPVFSEARRGQPRDPESLRYSLAEVLFAGKRLKMPQEIGAPLGPVAWCRMLGILQSVTRQTAGEKRQRESQHASAAPRGDMLGCVVIPGRYRLEPECAKQVVLFHDACV